MRGGNGYKVKRMKGRNCLEALSVGGWMNAEGR